MCATWLFGTRAPVSLTLNSAWLWPPRAYPPFGAANSIEVIGYRAAHIA
jgi:hypothetical protein